MPPEVLFVGGRVDSVAQIGILENSSATVHENTQSDVGMEIGSGDSIDVQLYTATSNVLSNTTVVSGETFWLHWLWYNNSSLAADTNLVVYYDSSGFPWFRIRFLNATNLFQMQYNSGTGASPVWTAFGNSIPLIDGSQCRWDVKLTMGSPHTVEVFLQSSFIDVSGSFTQASFTNISKAQFTRLGSSSAAQYFSQIAATRDISTVGARVKTLRATANGTNTAWAGVFTDVNEAVTSDATVNSSSTAAQKESHAMADVTTPAGFKLRSIWHWMRAKNDGVAPNNIKSLLRLSGVDYSTGNLSGISNAYGPVGARYDQNPATTADWADAGWNAAEAGYESAT